MVVLHDTMAHAFHRAIRRNAVPIKRQFNTKSLIHTLPLEILSTIFMIDILAHPQKQPQPRLQELARVCTTWKHIIISTPQIWSDVRLSRGDGELALKMSQKALIDVNCDDLNSGRDSDPNAFLALVQHHSQRWRSLYLASSKSEVADRMIAALQTPAPELRAITVIVERDWGDSAPLQVRPHIITIPITTSLRRVILSGITVNWSACKLSNLTTFHLMELPSAPPLSTICEVLLNSPLLQDLVLRDLGTEETVVETEISSIIVDSIVLPRLSDLDLGAGPPSLRDSLVGLISAPSLQTLGFYPALPHHFQPRNSACIHKHFALALGRKPHIMIAHSTKGPDPKIHIADDLDCSTSGVAITGFMKSRDFVQVAKFIQAAASPDTTIGLEVERRDHEELFDDIPEEDERFPVEALDFLPSLDGMMVGTLEDAIAVLQHLAQPNRGEDGVLRWPCPRLRELDLQYVRGLQPQTVSDFAHSRWGYAYVDDPFAQYQPRDLDTFILPSEFGFPSPETGMVP